MAVVPYTSVSTGHTNVGVFKWSAATWTAGDYGDPVALAPFADRTIHATYTGSAPTGVAFEIQGSLDGINWFKLEDSQGNFFTVSATDLAVSSGAGQAIGRGKAEVVGPATLYIRPVCTTTSGGSATSIDIILLCKGFS